MALHPWRDVQPRARGLTLIEILIVIGIMVMLAGLLLPLIGMLRTKARQTACSNNLAQLGAAVRVYAEQEGGRLPSSQHWGSANKPERSSAWFVRLPRMVSERKIQRSNSIFQCPAFSGEVPGLISNELPKSYKMNQDIDRVRNGRSAYRHQAFVFNRISDAERVVLFFDGITSGGAGQWGYGGVKQVDNSRHQGWVSLLMSDLHTVRTTATSEARAGSATVRWASADW